ncbi:UPF0738 family protein [Litchfieldia salsa]|uniref:UPF0738 protein SAMN05216565_102533 n=1 Tax=Litchfieldia salsa TaxID=930152 RepID=A0A1H0S4E9_9BACI|nr:hypothetical protein [Litchfieldia salsa]SDP36505.1 hypothetical protein SAMN05216565_102533 [Litchfieldia salsa]
MQKKIEITEIKLNGDRFEFYTSESRFELHNIKATGQMLVDSDGLSFIYIIENEQEYLYLSLPVTVWPSLQELLNTSYMPLFITQNDEVELEGMKDELSYLISNIEGNANYGEDMVKKVEELFLNKTI